MNNQLGCNMGKNDIMYVCVDMEANMSKLSCWIEDHLFSMTHIKKMCENYNKKLGSFAYGQNVKNEDDYRVLSPDDFYELKKGTCWDYVAAEAQWFKDRHIPFKTYSVSFFKTPWTRNGGYCITNHTFLVFEVSDKWYCFEASWKSQKGIHGPFNSPEDIYKWQIKLNIENPMDGYKKSDYKYVYVCEFDALNGFVGLSAEGFFTKLYPQRILSKKI